MLFPCQIKSNNGYTLKFIPEDSRRIAGTLIVSSIQDDKNFIFLSNNKLQILYTCLLGIFRAANSDKMLVRTIQLPNIKLDDFILLATTDKEKCLITIMRKHITDLNDTYKITDEIELSSEDLYTLVLLIGKTLYGELMEE
jgi:hypothetical protein